MHVVIRNYGLLDAPVVAGPFSVEEAGEWMRLNVTGIGRGCGMADARPGLRRILDVVRAMGEGELR